MSSKKASFLELIAALPMPLQQRAMDLFDSLATKDDLKDFQEKAGPEQTRTDPREDPQSGTSSTSAGSGIGGYYVASTDYGSLNNNIQAEVTYATTDVVADSAGFWNASHAAVVPSGMDGTYLVLASARVYRYGVSSGAKMNIDVLVKVGATTVVSGAGGVPEVQSEYRGGAAAVGGAVLNAGDQVKVYIRQKDSLYAANSIYDVSIAMVRLA